jgi:hypothetical protein
VSELRPSLEVSGFQTVVAVDGIGLALLPILP